MKGHQLKKRVPAKEKDPVDGVKFEEINMGDPLQIDTLRFRGEKYVALVERNATLNKSKKQHSDRVWDEANQVVRVAQPKGKEWRVMGSDIPHRSNKQRVASNKKGWERRRVVVSYHCGGVRDDSNTSMSIRQTALHTDINNWLHWKNPRV